MHLSNYDRVVIMAVDLRYPSYAQRTNGQLLEHGATEVQVFLNGRGRDGLDPTSYDLRHEGEPPIDWEFSRNVWDYGRAYRTVVSRAFDDGVERLLVCEDDLDFSPNFKAICGRAMIPDDWQLLYYGAMHWWASVPAESVAPYVLRLNGGQLGSQAIGWRREAMRSFLELPIDRPPDEMLASLHGVVPSYCLHPSVIRQAEGVESMIVPGEPFAAGFVYEIK